MESSELGRVLGEEGIEAVREQIREGYNIQDIVGFIHTLTVEISRLMAGFDEILGEDLHDEVVAFLAALEEEGDEE